MSESHASGRRLINATAVMASGTMVSRILGLVRAMLIAFVLGNGTRQVEAFNYANTVPTTLYLLLAGGTLNNVLVPQIVRAVTHDRDGGKAFVDRIITGFVILLGVVTLILTAATPLVMSLFAQAWTTPEMADHWASLLLMSYICMPQLFFYGVFFLIGQVLNARDRFGPMMWAPIANNVVSIGVFALYLGLWGNQTALSGDPFTSQQGVLLSLGSTLGIVIQTVVLLPYLKRAGFDYHPRFDLKGTGLGRTFHVAKWMVGFVGLTTAVQMLVANLASGATATGSADAGAGWTVYQNAYLIWILPHSLLTVSLATAMLPSASRFAVAGDRAGVTAETNRAVRLATTFLLPASIALFVLAQPITRLAFGNGTGAHDYSYIAWALAAFAVGLVPFTIQYLYLRAFFAMDNTRTPFFIQIAISGANSVAAVGLALPWQDPTTVAARLALAYSISYYVGVVITHFVLRRQLPELPVRTTMTHLLRLTVATLPAAALAMLITAWSEQSDQLLLRIGGLAVAGMVALLAFFFTAKRIGIPETTSLIGHLRRRQADAEPPVVPADQGPAEPLVTMTPEAAGTELDDTGSFVAATPAAATVPPSLLSEFPVPPAVGALPGEQVNGPMLGERYRMAERLELLDSTEIWRAEDVLLTRPVLIHLLDAADPRTAELLDSARAAALSTDPRFLRVLDVIEADPDLGPYLVYEYAAGQTLERILAAGPLSGVESAWIVREVADALITLHAHGQYHRQLSPATLLITNSGNVKVLGSSLTTTPVDRDSDPQAADLRGLGLLLYACLAARWPGGPAYGLPAAPPEGEGYALPSQVRPGVAPAVDQIVDRLLSPTPRGKAARLTTAQEVTTQLSFVLGPMGAAQDLRARLNPDNEPSDPAPISTVVPPRPTPATMSRLSSSTPAPSPAGSATGLPEDSEGFGDATMFVDRVLTRGESFTPVPPPRTELEHVPRARQPWPLRRVLTLVGVLIAVVTVIVLVTNLALTATPPGTASTTAAALGTRKTVAFDPVADGGDAKENNRLAKRATDANPKSAWKTERYPAASFGGLKPGVGVVVDLGETRTMTGVELQLSRIGGTVELRVPAKPVESAPMKTVESWVEVAQPTEVATDALEISADQPTQTRYVLVYFTALPSLKAGVYQNSIEDLVILGH